MIGKLPVPKSQQVLISVKDVFKRWQELNELDGYSVQECCDLLNDYHKDQTLRLCIKELRVDGVDRQFEDGQGIYLPQDISLIVVNNKEYQLCMERLLMLGRESVDSSLEAINNGYSSENRRAGLIEERKELSRQNRSIYWGRNEPVELVMAMDYVGNDVGANGVKPSIRGEWKNIYLHREDLAEFEGTYGINLKKERYVLGDALSNAESSQRTIEQVYPFLNPPAVNKQNDLFMTMDHCFKAFYMEFNKHITMREAWNYVSQSILKDEVPEGIKGLISVNDEGIHTVGKCQPTNKKSFLNNLKNYNKD